MRAATTSAVVRRTALRALVITLLVLGVAIGHALSMAGHSHAEATGPDPVTSTAQLVAAGHDDGSPAGAEAVALTCLAVLLAVAALLGRRATATAVVDSPSRRTSAQPRAPAASRHAHQISTVLQI